MIIIGIDPGVSGGIAVLYGGEVRVCPMPGTEMDICESISTNSYPDYKTIAFIEKVNTGFPGSSKSSMAKLYGNYASCRMACIAAGIRLEAITSSQWQNALGIPKRTKTETGTKWKNRLKAKAQELFPGVNVTLKTADALLIAEHGRRVSR